jgi:putative membrane protein
MIGAPNDAAQAAGPLAKIDADSRARTHLANERTFLAWQRTGLGLIVIGIGSAQFIARDRQLVPDFPIVSSFAAILIGGGALTTIVGCIRFIQSRNRIEAAAYRPANRSVIGATLFVVVVAALSLLLVILLRRP